MSADGIGVPPAGRAQMKQLVDAQRFDLVSAALRSLNPEGRVYAARALLAREKVDPKDAKAIESLRSLDVELTTSAGCFIGKKRFSAALEMLRN